VVGGFLCEFLRRHIPLIDEELSDAAEPFLVVAIFEVLERLHVFGAGAQRVPGPVAFEGGGQRIDRIAMRRVRQMRTRRHHYRMNAQDALFPWLDEYALFSADRPQIFDAAKMML